MRSRWTPKIVPQYTAAPASTSAASLGASAKVSGSAHFSSPTESAIPMDAVIAVERIVSRDSADDAVNHLIRHLFRVGVTAADEDRG